MSSGIKIVFGGAAIMGDDNDFNSSKNVKAILDVLQEGDVKVIDTAQLYPRSEERLGEAGASSRFTIDTKHVGGFAPDQNTGDILYERAKVSLQQLKTDKVDIFYIHSPPRDADLADLLAGVQKAYKAGYFSRFGLSNYHADEVEKVYDHCKANGYVLPSVYQGNYSAVTRKQETVLFPTLRKLGIAFYAYSPLAGGFLAKTKQQILDGAGRFNPSTFMGQMYGKLYNKPELLDVLAKFEAIANAEGISKVDLAYRWVRFNSPLKPEHGDAMIIGASSLEQLRGTLKGSNGGPLSTRAVEGIDAIWDLIKEHAPLDNFNQ